MARPSKRTKLTGEPTSAANDNAVKWVNITLTEADLTELDTHTLDYGYLAELAIETAARGGSFGVKVAPRGDGFMAYLIRPSDDNPGIQLGISGYASTPSDACLALVFKYAIRLSERLESAGISDRPARRFG